MGKRGVNSNISDVSKKRDKKTRLSGKSDKSSKTKKPRKTYKTFKQAFRDSREKVWDKKRKRVILHHSFRRSYREDYKRDLKAPGLVSHAMTSLKILFRNWKIFGLLLVVVVASNILFVGIMNEENYQSYQESLELSNEVNGYGELGRFAKSGMLLLSSITSAGLDSNPSDVQIVFLVIFALMLWLITTYFLRHILAGNKPRFRDGLYNAFAPIISVLLVVVVLFIHLIPFFIFLILYSTAVATQFLSAPLYNFLFWLLSSLLILLSLYLVPISLIALSSVTVPGIYPMQAIHAATDLIQSRRTKYIIRVIFLIIVLALLWIVFMLPITYLDLWMKEEMGWLVNWPIVPFFLQIMTAFSIIYATSYLYLFYRRMLENED